MKRYKLEFDIWGLLLFLTDIAKYKNPDNAFIVVANWMRNHSTISFLGLWEQIHNPNFKPIEFDRFKAESGDNAFTLTPQQWIKATDAIGIISKSGRYGGTYAHTDIAFEFASWISPEFKLYIIKDYQRLKKDEANRLAIGWDAKRELSKINYRIHTDAVKEFLITPTLSSQEMAYTYASEADILNIWRFNGFRKILTFLLKRDNIIIEKSATDRRLVRYKVRQKLPLSLPDWGGYFCDL